MVAICNAVGLAIYAIGLYVMACLGKYCKPRELGCPAEQLFSKTKRA